MKPGKLDLPTIWRGCDWGPVTLKWKDQNGDPINIGQWQAVAQSLNINLNPAVSDGPGGVTTLSLTRAQTATLKLGVESWDWIWQRPEATYRFPPFLAGKVAIKEPTSGLNGSLPIPLPPDTPEAIAATGVVFNTFFANWLESARATGYRLDVSANVDFTTFVPGFQNRDVGNVLTQQVVNINGLTTYHYRVRAHNTGGTTLNSNVIHVTTPAPPPPPNDTFNVNNPAMTGLTGQLTGTIFGATRETGEPAGDNSVWYTWRPNAAGNGGIVLETALAKISVYIDIDPTPSVGNLQHVATSIVNPAGRSFVIFPTLPDTLYRIRVYRNTGITAFTMTWGWEA